MNSPYDKLLAPDGVVWRIQSGPLLHLGLSANREFVWQKSAVTGASRLKLIRMHLVTRIDTGQLEVELDSEGTTSVTDFLKRVLQEGSLGTIPTAIVFPRELARREPGVLAVATSAGIEAAYASNAFKQRQKISRHFEEFLRDRLLGHSLLARLENLTACMPDLVAAWNESGQQTESDLTRRYLAGAEAVRARLGVDPRSKADEEFRARRFAVRELSLVVGVAPDFQFVGSFGEIIDYSGFDLTFVSEGSSFRASVFSRDVPARAAGDRPQLTVRDFNPDALLLQRSDVPAELQDEWRPGQSHPDKTIRLSRVLQAMGTRGVCRSDVADLLREIVARWTVHSGTEMCAPTPADTQPSGELRTAGVVLMDESFERIRERHFWRAIAHWALRPGLMIGFARVQIESDGRLNCLREHPFFTAAGQEMNALLHSLFLPTPDLIVPPEVRRGIVAALKQRASTRLPRQDSI